MLRRLSLLASPFGSLLLALVLVVPASAATGSDGSVGNSGASSAQPTQQTESQILAHQTAGETLRVARSRQSGSVVPAQSSCNWNATVNVTSTYFINTLASVDAKGTSYVNCSPGLIDFLFNDATIQKNQADIGSTANAPSCTAPSCNSSTANVDYYCGLDQNAACAGKYRTRAHFTIVLQPPYYWPAPAPGGCTIGGSGSERLECNYVTPEVTVLPIR